MAGNDVEMSHSEMWDDSALIESWNEALDEYKKYHSIHTKGGKLKDLDLQEKTEDAQTVDDAQTQAVDQREIADDATEGADKTKGLSSTDVKDQADSVPMAAKANAPPGPATMGPQSLLGSVQDEGLKRLLMSWYYAGYYTGLYEGQQQQ
ncbi:hypothetical protein CFIO01_04528 [Colletotrichum fioriniae PJ7]|uniref:Survival Motor Neuron Gemin2-binding domain-containing protein n=1 Tax=Colletotrichum fioriniae PJ7 TaxID=1445577 RepID=A0A010SES4_9PEZI|nr:hypothetical protein CFIO01_04528 [Colletotrichum fioriniae PJ7]